MALTVIVRPPRDPKTNKSMFFEDPDRFQRQTLPTKMFTAHLEAMVTKYRIKSYCELGCGLGVDVAAALSIGLDAYGVDGSEALRPHVLFPKERYYLGDVTQDLNILTDDLRKPDACGCRETAEHIPFASSLQLVKNIVRNSHVCYFTAAPPGQAGSGHINCRSRLVWVGLFEEFGWTVDEEITAIVKDRAVSNIDRKSGMVLHGPTIS